jgi:hypothetical protein
MEGTDAMLQTVREWFRSHYPGDDPDELTIKARSGREVRHSFPTVIPAVSAPPPPAPDEEETVVDAPAPPSDELQPCERDILDAIEAADKRLKRDTVVRCLRDSGKTWGDSTVWRHLSGLVAKGLLSRREDQRGFGYGLPFWDTEGS